MDNFLALFIQNRGNYPYFVATKSTATTITGESIQYITNYNTVYPGDASGTIFNVPNGKFKAPVKGLYQFNINFSVVNQSAVSNDGMTFEIKVEGNGVIDGFVNTDTVNIWDEMEQQPNDAMLMKTIAHSFMLKQGALVGFYFSSMEDTLTLERVSFNAYLVTAFS